MVAAVVNATALPLLWTEAELEEDEVMALRDSFSAALARLALARKWIEGAHLDICAYNMTCGKYPCDCGRDALLKALEEPR